MNIVYVSSEMVPMVKVGGLADVVGALSMAMKTMGHRVKVIIPYCGTFDLKSYSFSQSLTPVRIRVKDGEVDVHVYECRNSSGVEICALRCPHYFEKEKRVYVNEMVDPIRFGIFSRAAATVIGQEAGRWDVVHCHDWPSALVVFFLKKMGIAGKGGGRIPTVFTIHNLSHQGVCSSDVIDALGIGWEEFNPDGIEFYGKVNILKAGIVYSEMVTTVSPNYAREVLTPENGVGLDGLLRSLGERFVGIPNGIDVTKWNPEVDGFIEENYTFEDLSGKDVCKSNLQRKMGLVENSDATLIGLVARLTYQKGIDLLLSVAARVLSNSKVQLCVLGEGESDIEEKLKEVAGLWEGRMGVLVGFDEPLSHKIYAGCDIFLIPSRFEPCGLSAMISMRYGTIAVARKTGGLADTVVDADRFLDTGSGFTFEKVDPIEFYGAILRAVYYHRYSRGEWRRLQKRVMKKDFSWREPARKYQRVYETIVNMK